MPEIKAGEAPPLDTKRFSWYDRASRFRMTLRKEEIKGKNGSYWYAYVKAYGKTCKAYVGRDAMLTSARLFEVALALKVKAGIFKR